MRGRCAGGLTPMSQHPDAAIQLAFARHLRDPQRHAAPAGLDPQRVATYRRLFFNNVESVLGANFPVIAQVLGPQQWPQLVRRFYAEHPSAAPLFTELSREFVAYLRQLQDPPRPFLAELAHYEWVELALLLDPQELAQVPVDAATDLLQGRVVCSPLAWLLVYRHPVHRIRPEHQPEQPPPLPSYLVVYRARDDQIGFMELNQVSARLLELLGSAAQQQPPLSGRQVLAQLATELGMDAAQLQPLALEQMQLWLQRDILLGSCITAGGNTLPGV